MERGALVKNKEPAPVQITAEQILREAFERREPEYRPPKIRISDPEELAEYQSRKRREFEEYVRRNPHTHGNWMRYAAFELELKEYARARSIFERGLEVLPTNVPLWMRYIEAEMHTKNINHARNLLDRAVTLMPRVDTFWYKYVYMEEVLDNVAGLRQTFERWMSWQPDEGAWRAYINMERRHGSLEHVKALYERFTVAHPDPQTWIKWARFEEDCNSADDVRQVFTLAIDTLGDSFADERLFIAYALFEAKLKEFARARAIFKFALDRIPRNSSKELYRQYTVFEKQFGDKDGIEEMVIQKRRVHYEERVKELPFHYDYWFDYTKLEESTGDVERTREIYERAVAHVPPNKEKRFWRRYIFLWIYYACFEELECNDIERTRQIYKQAIDIVPHKSFTFAKLWLLYAQFEIRQHNVSSARKLLGMALGMCPKSKLYTGYIELEMQLREFDRCRILHQKYLEWAPSKCAAWIKFADLESTLGDVDRARAIYELATEQDVLDLPELLWKAYIDFEFDEEEYEKTRLLYRRLLEKTQHVKVWMSFVQFEISIPEEDETETVSQAAKGRARSILSEALAVMKQRNLKEERFLLLEASKKFEKTHGTAEDVARVESQMPKLVKKRRELEDGTTEEYTDYLFPADLDSNAGALKLLQAAQAWKAKMDEAESKKKCED